MHKRNSTRAVGQADLSKGFMGRELRVCRTDRKTLARVQDPPQGLLPEMECSGNVPRVAGTNTLN
ncbi:hypothetical protein KO529_01620 [Arenibacter algicola]|uniref:hypothetical protein n=1 Tax=Arenibacter algicola TaxID=616991 RepID=UPI001C067934|nr:hypothetical protein [Arenibacter algicola]MBU2903468.1 hypothetical protein [Arenibacter algicola]